MDERNYWTVDDDIVCDVVGSHAQRLHEALAEEIGAARSLFDVSAT